MLSKNEIGLITSLQQKKYRKQHNLFVVEGEKMVAELLESEWPVHSIYYTKEIPEKFVSDFKDKDNLKYEQITEAQLLKVSALTTPQSILAVASIPQRTLDTDTLKEGLSLLLDEIKDPGNLGTIIRIANWFGIETIICSENAADVYNPKVVQATMGSLFRVNIFYADLSTLLKQNAQEIKLPVFGTMLNGENLYQTPLSRNGFILIGNESKGISEELIPFITKKILIPSFAQDKKIDSLNAAMAAAIVCSEFRRQ